MTAVQPGDVILVRTGSIAGTLIRLGAALTGKPNLASHVCVLHHVDEHGTPWALEGRPGGAGWRDARQYLSSSWELDNAAQPKTPEQRAAVCKTMEALIGTAYDYRAIAADAFAALHMRLPGWDPSWRGTVPGQAVCSSLAAYAYAKAGLRCPAGDRGVVPGDWDTWVLTRGWTRES
jgi:hypothetical protein